MMYDEAELLARLDEQETRITTLEDALKRVITSLTDLAENV